MPPLENEGNITILLDEVAKFFANYYAETSRDLLAICEPKRHKRKEKCKNQTYSKPFPDKELKTALNQENHSIRKQYYSHSYAKNATTRNKKSGKKSNSKKKLKTAKLILILKGKKTKKKFEVANQQHKCPQKFFQGAQIKIVLLLNPKERWKIYISLLFLDFSVFFF